jgi:uncharacterized protein
MDVAGKTVLITGATGGLGQEIARAFAAADARLILSGRRTEVLGPIASETGARVLAADLSQPDAPRRLVEQAGDVDILVAAAGLPASGPVDSFTVEQVDRALDVNLRAPILLSRAYAPRMAERGGGHIVLMSSLSGKAATAGTALYSATKFGLRGFGLSMREDWRDRGVGVSILFPGFIRDAGLFHDAGARLPPGVATKRPEDVAAAAVRAVRRNRAEIHVVPLALRASMVFTQLTPELSAHVARLLGSHRVAHNIAAGQTDKR